MLHTLPYRARAFESIDWRVSIIGSQANDQWEMKIIGPRILRDWVLNPCVAESRIFREIRVRKLHPLLEGRRTGGRASCYGRAFSRLLRPVVARARVESKGCTGRSSSRSTQSCPVCRSGLFHRTVRICGDALAGAN